MQKDVIPSFHLLSYMSPLSLSPFPNLFLCPPLSPNHGNTVNAVVWAPYEDDDLQLALGTSEGQISILRLHDGQWHYSEVAPHDDPAYIGGVLGISWAPPSIAFVRLLRSRQLKKTGCWKEGRFASWVGCRGQGKLA